MFDGGPVVFIFPDLVFALMFATPPYFFFPTDALSGVSFPPGSLCGAGP